MSPKSRDVTTRVACSWPHARRQRFPRRIAFSHHHDPEKSWKNGRKRWHDLKGKLDLSQRMHPFSRGRGPEAISRAI